MANDAFSRSEDVKNIEGAEVESHRCKIPKERVAAETGNNGFLVFPKSTVKTEEHLRELLRIIDRMLDEAVATLLSLGIKGVHWERKGENGYGKIMMLFSAMSNRIVTAWSMEVAASVPLEREPIAQRHWRSRPTSITYPEPGIDLQFSDLHRTRCD